MIKEVIINLEVVDGEEDGYCILLSSLSFHSENIVRLIN